MGSPACERIDGLTFAQWKEDSVPPPAVPAALPFFGIRLLLTIGFCASITVAHSATAAGNTLVLFTGLSSAALLVAALVARGLRRGIQDKDVLPPKDATVPEHAIPVLACVMASKLTLGTSRGWLWVDGGWLRFSGVRTEFRLQRLDFASPSLMAARLYQAGTWEVRTGPRVPPLKIAWMRLLGPDGSITSPPSDALEAWEASRPPTPSLLPPVRADVTPERRLPLPYRLASLVCLILTSLYAATLAVDAYWTGLWSVLALFYLGIPLVVLFVRAQEARRATAWNDRIKALAS